MLNYYLVVIFFSNEKILEMEYFVKNSFFCEKNSSKSYKIGEGFATFLHIG
jgi:hypothetical protein